MSMASTPIGGHCVALWCPTVFSAWVKWWHPSLFRKSSMKPRPSGSQCQVSCIYLWWGWDSKLQFIKEPPPHGCASSSALEAPYTLTMFFVTENQSSALEVGTFYAVAPQIVVTRLSPLCTGLCPLQIKAHLLMPTVSFVLGDSIYPLPYVIQKGEQSLPVWPMRTLHHFVPAPHPKSSFSPVALTTAPFWRKYHTSQSSEFELWSL